MAWSELDLVVTRSLRRFGRVSSLGRGRGRLRAVQETERLEGEGKVWREGKSGSASRAVPAIVVRMYEGEFPRLVSTRHPR